MAFCRQIVLCMCILGLGQCFDEAAMLQDVEIRSHVDEAPKTEKNSALRAMLKSTQMPGLAGAADSLPANMPEIDMGEVMGLIDLLPPLIKAVSDELPHVVTLAQHMEQVAMREAATLEAGNAASQDAVVENIKNMVTKYKEAWVPFATALVDGLNTAIVPTIRHAQERVSFIPANATTMLVNTVTDLINRTAMSGLAQLPVNVDLVRVNRKCFKMWNATNTTMSFLRGLLLQEGSLLDTLTMLPTPGVNLTEVVLTLKPQAVAIVQAVEGANNNVSFSLHHVSERAGVAWTTKPAEPEEDKEESGSTGVRAGFTFVIASALALLRL